MRFLKALIGLTLALLITCTVMAVPTYSFGYNVYNAVTASDISPDSQTVVFGTETGTIWFFNAKTGAFIRGISNGGVGIHFLKYSPDGASLAIGLSNDYLIRLRLSDLVTTEVNAGVTSYPNPSAYTADGNIVAVGTFDGTVLFATTCQTEIVNGLVTNSPVQTISFSPDGEVFALGETNGNVSVYYSPFYRVPGDYNGDGYVDDFDFCEVVLNFGNWAIANNNDTQYAEYFDDFDFGNVVLNFGNSRR